MVERVETRRGEREEPWMQHHDKMASVYKDRRL
jgi:hypothetical protein